MSRKSLVSRIGNYILDSSVRVQVIEIVVNFVYVSALVFAENLLCVVH